jgi:hypothetical protein
MGMPQITQDATLQTIMQDPSVELKAPTSSGRSQSVSEILVEEEDKIAFANFFSGQAVDPSFLLLQFMPYPGVNFAALPESFVSVALDELMLRAISVLDRTPISELHKIGVVYAGPNQTTEGLILANTHGSRCFTWFLSLLGKLFALKDARHVYTGGLDTSPEQLDGQYGLMHIYDRRMEQIIFHVTTMMPTKEHDTLCTGKKRHIGNDYVSIVWNESGYLYNHDTIAGQFNFVVIVIEPLTSTDVHETITRQVYDSLLFRVSVSVKAGLPDSRTISDASKIVTGSSLPAYVRQMAVHANTYCQIVASKETGYTSNARERLAQIKRLKTRTGSKESASKTLDFTINL